MAKVGSAGKTEMEKTEGEKERVDGELAGAKLEVLTFVCARSTPNSAGTTYSPVTV